MGGTIVSHDQLVALLRSHHVPVVFYLFIFIEVEIQSQRLLTRKRRRPPPSHQKRGNAETL